MSRFFGILSVILVVILSMAFAAANAGNWVTLELGIFTLYRAPVTLVAFGGLLVGMLVMFATGIHTDLKVRKILRDRLAEDSRKEQGWIDRNQQDLFSSGPEGTEADSPMDAPPDPGSIDPPEAAPLRDSQEREKPEEEETRNQ